MTAAAVRKTGEARAATAATYTAWIAGGRCWTTAGLAWAGACTPAGSALGELVTEPFVKIAPKTETPIEPPTCLNSVEPEVATPSSR